MQAHFAADREAVKQLPRLWSLKSVSALDAEPKQDQPGMIHLSAMHMSGTPPSIIVPPDGTHISPANDYFQGRVANSNAAVSEGEES